MADATRFTILRHLAASPRCVGELVTATGQTQSNVSHHLRRLRACGFVQYDRDGRQNRYRVSDPAVAALVSAAEAAHEAVSPLCTGEVC